MNHSNKQIQNRIDELESLLLKYVSSYQLVSAEDLLAYFEGEVPSGDETTLEDILNNRWLFIHELVEVSELKNMGLEISASLFRSHPLQVDLAHITATEYELYFARDDKKWIQDRLADVNAWQADKGLPAELRARCAQILGNYGNQEGKK